MLDPANAKVAEESAKAIQEGAKLGQKALDTADKLGSFLNKVAGEAFLELGGMITDRVRVWRFTQTLKLVDKVEAILSQRCLGGKKLRTIPPAQLFPLLSDATLVDEDNLQDLWAGLLANASDPEKTIEANIMFTRILAELNGQDAIILQLISTPGPSWRFGALLKELSERLDKADQESYEARQMLIEQLLLSLENLVRLRCIEHISLSIDIATTKRNHFEDESKVFVLTHLGKALMQACAT